MNIKQLKMILIIVIILMSITAHSNEEGPIASWNFEGSSATIKDSSENHNDGKISGNVARVKGIDGKALEFTGSKDDFVIVETTSTLALQTQLSIEAWICRTDTGTIWDGIITNGDPKKGYLVFYSEKTQCLTLYLNTDTQGFGAVLGAYIPIDEWMHIAVTYDSSAEKVRIFQNGEKTAEQTYKGKIKDFPRAFYLGKADNYQAFRGKLDNVKIYCRVLSEDEIKNEYKKYSANLPTPAPVPPVIFENLKAEKIAENKVKLSFDKTAKFLEMPEGKDSGLSFTLIRTQSPRNDENPGVKTSTNRITAKITSADKKHYEYIHEAPLEPGTTYYYRISAAPNPPDVFRVAPAKLRIYNPDIWWSEKKINEKIDEIAARFPELTEIKEIGKTVQGRPLRVLYAGKAEKKILLFGNMHVSESGPELILPAIEKILRENPGLLNKISIAALPCITLDERERMLNTGYALYLRKNANKIDLNRNFDGYWEAAVKDVEAETYQGSAPGTEPEVKTVMSLIEETKPLAIFSFHSIASLTNGLFLYSRFAEKENNQEYIERCKLITGAYADGLYGAEKDKYYSVEGFGSPGTLGSWAYKAHKIPCFDVELDKNPIPRKFVYGDAVPLWLLEEYQVRHQKAIENLIKVLSKEK